MASPARADFGKVAGIIRRIRSALLTTVDDQGNFHTRPMQTLRVENDLTLWFFTDFRSAKAHELGRDVRVALGYAQPTAGTFVSLSGTGTLLRHPQKAAELWTLEQRAYFPEGPGDERLALLKVRVESAEYWIAPGRTTHLLAALKAAVTRIPARVVGENARVP